MLVYVLNRYGVPLMPSIRNGHIRWLLKENQAKVVKKTPFTIQLLYDVPGVVQEVEAKLDTGYQHIGASGCSDKAEIYSAEVELLTGQVERLEDRRKYRRTRRNKLRYRKPRYNNRKNKKEGWIAPSIQHKVDSHVKTVEQVRKILPISKVTIEVGNFDIQKLKNPDIQGKEYQQGEMYDFRNVREYIFFRDNYTCQICGRNAFKDGVSLHWHHREYWKGNHSDRPGNGMTVCTDCHCSKNHQPKGKLWGIEAIDDSFKAETYMATVRWIIKKALEERLGIPVEVTYGYLTKSTRIALDLSKTHFNDAYCIGERQPPERLAETVFFTERRKNNRSLEKFYDAQYIDARDGSKKAGKDLASGRSTRNKNKNTENLHKYRKQKLKAGYRTIRKQRSTLQPYDTVLWKNRLWIVKGTHCNNTRVMVADNSGAKSKSAAIKQVRLINHSKTFIRKDKQG